MEFKEGDIVRHRTSGLFSHVCIVLTFRDFTFRFKRKWYKYYVYANFNWNQTTYIGSDDLLTYINIL